MQKAIEAAPGNVEYSSDLERLLRRIPEQHCAALQVCEISFKELNSVQLSV